MMMARRQRLYALHLGDSVQTIDQIESESVGIVACSARRSPACTSTPIAPHDMGNVASIGEMVEQFSHLMAPGKMGRAMMPGRSVYSFISRKGWRSWGSDGYVGLKDFRGDLIRMMEGNNWIYYGEVTIDKNPQVKAIRTRDAGLTFKSLATDAARMHPALAEYAVAIQEARRQLCANPSGEIREVWQHHGLGDE